jgi:small subunit ribosomal protein S6
MALLKRSKKKDEEKVAPKKAEKEVEAPKGIDESLQEEASDAEIFAAEINKDLVQYELTYLLVPTVNDVEQGSVSEHIRKIVEKIEGKIADESIWGKQKLSYEIQGHNMGLYVVLKLNLQPRTVVELEKQLKLIEPIMRFLLIKKDSEKVKRLQAERDAKRAKKKEAAAAAADPELEVLTKETAAKIKEEMKKDLAEKKVTSEKDLEAIDKKLDEILEDDLDKNPDIDK